MVNVALIGCGAIAPAHADAFAVLPGVRLSAVVDIWPDRATNLAATYGISTVHTDYRRVLDADDVDAVAILTENDSHAQIAVDAAEAGKHILLEKPMARTIAESQRILEAAETHGVKLMVGQTARYQPVNQALRRAIVDGEVGKPAYLHLVWNHGMFWGGWQAWQIRRQISGGHIVHNGVHALDLTAWLLDQPIESVYTQRHRVGSSHLETEEDFRMTIRCTGGAIALCEISYALPTRDAHLRTIEVIGDEGRASHSSLDDGLFFHSNGLQFISPDPPDSMRHQNQAFVDYLRNDGPPPVSGRDGQQALAAALAARRSADEKRPVRVAEIMAEYAGEETSHGA